MAAIESRQLLRDESLSSHSDDLPMEEDSAASILASVKEQEQQFALLTKEIEEERKTVAKQLNHDQYNDMETNKGMETSNYYTTPQNEYVTETVSRREDYSNPHEETEVIVDENGVPKTVTKRVVMKTVTEQRVRRVEDQGSLPRNNHSNSRRGSDPDRQYNSVPRNHNNFSDPYEDDDDDEKTGLLQRRPSDSSSDVARQPSGYNYSQPRGSRGSNEVSKQAQIEKFQPEDYGLEDDRRSDYNDDDDQYGLEPSSYNEGVGRRSRSVSSVESDQPRYDEQLNDMPVAAPRNDMPVPVARAPLATQDAGSRASLDRVGDGWHAPTLPEVIKMLSYPVPVVQQNAAAYLQHLCFNDDKIKADVRTLGGIPPLIKLLDNGNPAIELNACGALRNLSFGSNNDKNKIEIKTHEGVPAVVRLIRSTKDIDTKEQATGTLWNLSAHPELKGQVLELGLEPLTSPVIIPYSETISQQDGKPKEIVMVDVFTNAVGVVRNLSSTDSQDSRRRLRECSGLVYALIRVLQANKESGDIDNKATENCMCILRNLTYKLQEETPNREYYMLDEPRSASNDKTETTCFGKPKNKDKSLEAVEEIPPDDPDATGAELLWQPEISQLYVSLLQEAHRQELVEAVLGALLNLTKGTWKWSVYARIVVRKEKGLPIIIDRLRTDNDQVIRVGTTTLSNLAEDKKNKELIGKFAMKDLVYKLPGGSDPSIRLSDRTTIAVLITIRILVEKNPDNVRHLRDASGIERITTMNLAKDSTRFNERVVKAAGQVLQAVWANKETRSTLKKDGWNKNHFTPSVAVGTLKNTGAGTLGRPYEEPRSSSNPTSTGGRRAQRRASQTADEVQMTSLDTGTTDSAHKKGSADSYV